MQSGRSTKICQSIVWIPWMIGSLLPTRNGNSRSFSSKHLESRPWRLLLWVSVVCFPAASPNGRAKLEYAWRWALPRNILSLIILRGRKLTAIGVVIGLGGALLASQAIASPLFGGYRVSDQTVITNFVVRFVPQQFAADLARRSSEMLFRPLPRFINRN